MKEDYEVSAILDDAGTPPRDVELLRRENLRMKRGKAAHNLLFASMVCAIWIFVMSRVGRADHADQWAYGLICMLLGAGWAQYAREWVNLAGIRWLKWE